MFVLRNDKQGNCSNALEDNNYGDCNSLQLLYADVL